MLWQTRLKASGTKSALLIIGVRIRPSDVKSGGILNEIKKEVLVRRVVYAVSALFLVPFIKLRLGSFLTARFRFTRKYRSIESLRKHPPQADIYMTGSDQVWNSRYNNGVDRAFFLDFTESPKNFICSIHGNR